MKTTFKLSFMMFVEWFIWGAWFVPLWLWLNKSGFSAGEIGWSYACTAIAAILSPILVGSVTDRFFSAQKVLAVLMFAGGRTDVFRGAANHLCRILSAASGLFIDLYADHRADKQHCLR
ncbi:nucleoside transporter [Salmonella enterica subsp. enterica]|nr:nucleoside transporter [Salmonella enterica subsp. enterica]